MKYSFAVLAFLCSLILFEAEAQSITYHYPDYFLEVKVVDKRMITSMLTENENSKSLMLESASYYAMARTWGYITLGVAIGTVLLTATTDSGRNGLGKIAVGLLGTTGTVIAGVVSLLHSEEGRSKYKSAIDVYNDGLSYYDKTYRADLVISQNGLGVIYKF